MNPIRLITIIGLCLIVTTLVFSQENDDEDEKSCNCPADIDLICATNGKTYKNECIFNCEPLDELCPVTIAFHKSCKHACKCGKKDMPVCGTDLFTYSSVCLLNCEAVRLMEPCLQVLYNGTCEEYDALSESGAVFAPGR